MELYPSTNSKYSHSYQWHREYRDIGDEDLNIEVNVYRFTYMTRQIYPVKKGIGRKRLLIIMKIKEPRPYSEYSCSIILPVQRNQRPMDGPLAAFIFSFPGFSPSTDLP